MQPASLQHGEEAKKLWIWVSKALVTPLARVWVRPTGPDEPGLSAGPGEAGGSSEATHSLGRRNSPLVLGQMEAEFYLLFLFPKWFVLNFGSRPCSYEDLMITWSQLLACRVLCGNHKRGCHGWSGGQSPKTVALSCSCLDSEALMEFLAPVRF